MSQDQIDDQIDLEQLAAFIDGRLSGEARDPVVESLARSDEAYEVFAETLSFGSEQTAQPAKALRFWPAAIALAAAAGLAVLLGRPLTRWLRSPEASALSGVESVALITLPQDAAARLGVLWEDRSWSVTRGGATRLSEPQLSFRLGARSADLGVALSLNDRSAADRLAGEVLELLEGVELSEPVALRYRDLRTRLQAGTPAADLVATAVEAEASLATLLGSARFDLGRWCAAAELAARLKDSTLFLSSASNAFLDKVDRLGLEASDREALRRVAALTADGITESEYQELQALLEAIIKRNAG